MGTIIAILIGYSFIIIPRLALEKQWKEMVVFSLLTIFGILFALLFIFGVDLPMVSTSITSLFKTLYKTVGIKVE